MTRWNRLTREDAKRLGIEVQKEGKNKYNNRKPEVDGIVFDSQKEAYYYMDLKLAKMAGEIKDFELQPEFILQEGFRDKNGHWHRAIKYRADFKVINNDGRIEVIDTKGYKTPVYRIKKKLLLAKYPDINFREE